MKGESCHVKLHPMTHFRCPMSHAPCRTPMTFFPHRRHSYNTKDFCDMTALMAKFKSLRLNIHAVCSDRRDREFHLPNSQYCSAFIAAPKSITGDKPHEYGHVFQHSWFSRSSLKLSTKSTRRCDTFQTPSLIVGVLVPRLIITSINCESDKTAELCSVNFKGCISSALDFIFRQV